jgi:hypothetical protein
MADKDINELSPEEQTALAYERSNVSKEDFDPSKDGFADADKVVELPDRASVVVGDLVDHPDPVIASDAQAVVDGNYPGGPNYPNGPAESSTSAEPRKETSAGTTAKADVKQ